MERMRLIALVFLLHCIGVHANLPPAFSVDMNNLALSESTQVGDVVFTLRGSDPEDSPVYFALYGTDRLIVNRTTGAVTVVKPLDHEINDTLSFTVTIEDEVKNAPIGGNNIVQMPVTVIILDENDNPPIFENVPYKIDVDEDAPPDTTVFSQIVVRDPDTVGDEIDVVCEALHQPHVCDIFEIARANTTQNSYAGSLVLRQPLNYSVQHEYKLLLRALDGEFNATTVVDIKVADAQNTPPKFFGPLTAQINEDVPINTLVLQVYAEDQDRGDPRRVVYELSSNPMDYFLIDSVTGEIRTAKPLDKEAIENEMGILIVNVTAREIVNEMKGRDNLTVTHAQVTIVVKDVNDEAPMFNKREYFITIPEDIGNGTPLPNLNMTVTDRDVGANSEFSLRLDDISNTFTIDPKTVQGSAIVRIRTANSTLDYEDPNQRKFIILVIAEELYTDPKLSSTATITITVTDANDNPPTFDQHSYTASVSEVAPPGTLITTINARDRDTGHFGELGIVYQLLGDGAEKFSVNGATGAVTVSDCATPGEGNCLDYETQAEYTLSYKATDDEGMGRTTLVPFTIKLIDANDNVPTFTQPLYQVYVDEGAAKFSADVLIEAVDADVSSHVTYSLIAGDRERFSIDPNSGKLRIIAHEGLQATGSDHVALTVEATDGKFTATALVNVTIRDVNNNAPVFERSNYVAAVPEDVALGEVVATVAATDADTGVNANVSYHVQKGAFGDFVVDSVSGAVRTAARLDYDRRNTYNVEVVATDGGVPSLTGTTTVTIQVVNVNDKKPYFVPALQKAEVMENAPVGATIHTLTAMDPDVASADALNFAFTEPITALDKHGVPVFDDAYKHFFAVDPSGRVYVQNALQRDVAAVVRIAVLVTDITAPTVQQGEGILVITITDVNDHPPQFPPPWTIAKPSYNLLLQEEQPVGTIVATYTATDDDSAIAFYQLLPDSDHFEINRGTGIVQIKRRIDYETVTKLNFTVVAFDSGVPQLNATAFIDVTVLNINDNAPVFSAQRYNATVRENSPNGTVFLRVKATDRDAGQYGTVTYSLAGPQSQFFAIDAQTGDVSVAAAEFLDHERLQEVEMQVVATDGGRENMKRSVTVPVHVRIEDVNDNAPRFAQAVYNATISEDIKLNPPFPILKVNATDEDAGVYGNVHFRLRAGNEEDLFLMGVNTGILYPHKSLVGHTGPFRLEVEARDGAGAGEFIDTAVINLQVLNINEHKPIFVTPSSSNAMIELAEDSAIEGYLALNVRATDADQGENGRISYSFRVNGEYVQETDAFHIDARTGELRTRKTLDRETQNKYNLTLIAKDNGQPISLQTEAFLTIAIVDVNDNNPEFTDVPYHFSIDENSPPNVKIGQVKANDRDEGRHATVYYYIVAGNANNSFRLDKLEGDLYAAASFDRERTHAYHLMVLASNEPDLYFADAEAMNATQNASIASVTITINDLNDNAPQFDRDVYYAAVQASADVNAFVTNVSASDADLGMNASLFYYIKSSNLYKYGTRESLGYIIPSPFNITEDGELTTAVSLNENNQHHFVVEVVAKEVAWPERETLVHVHVWVFEMEQLIRIILSRPKEEVMREQNEIVVELSNVTQSHVIIHDIRYHTMDNGMINEDWSDMFVLVVNPSTQTIVPVYDVLKVVDANYDFLKDYYAGFAIENVIPAFAIDNEETFNSTLATIVALLLVFFVGLISFIVVCGFIHHWMISPHKLKKKDALIKKAIIDDLNTTENPLWIEQKLKIYEEQELTMQVFNEPEHLISERRESVDFAGGENTYATIQHPNRRGSVHKASIGEVADYATLSRLPHNPGSSHSSFSETPNYYEAALGFQGSTFQVPVSARSQLDSFDGRSDLGSDTNEHPVAQNQVQRSHIPHLHSVHRITSFPVVESGWNFTEHLYHRFKKSNGVLNWALGQAEFSLNTMVDTALPAVNLFERPLNVVDKILCHGLDVVENKIPALHLPPQEMYSNTKQYVSDVGNKIIKPVLQRADSVKQIGTTVLTNKYTVYAADTLDGALNVADKYVDRYLPADATEANDNPSTNSHDAKAIQTIQHMDRFSRKFKRRLTRRTLAEAKALKDQSAEAIHVLAYVVDLVRAHVADVQYVKEILSIAKDPRMALEKGKELWADLSKDEPENQSRPETLEQLIVMLTRESARRMVHFVNFTNAQISKIPEHINAMTNRFIDVLANLAKAVHLDVLSGAVVNGTKQRAHRFTMFLHQINSYTIAILENIAHRLEEREQQLKPTTSASRMRTADNLKPPTSRTQLRASNVFANIVNGMENSTNN